MIGMKKVSHVNKESHGNQLIKKKKEFTALLVQISNSLTVGLLGLIDKLLV